ncbi:hypothetical protein ABZ372_48870, partial [Streptomyces sp. NPDC005921]
ENALVARAWRSSPPRNAVPYGDSPGPPTVATDLVEAIRNGSAADAAEVARRHVAAARASAKVAMNLLKQEAD